MSAIPGPEAFATRSGSGRQAQRRLFSWNGAWTAGGLLVLAAIALRTAWHVNADVSWLLELAERTLDGAVPYRDYSEVNPPASILLYVPAVVLARLLGASPERMTDALVFLGAPCSLAISASILAKAKLIAPPRARLLGLCALFVLLILPLNSFAQREHIAVLAMLPILAALAARASGARLGPTNLVLAGIAAAVGISIKPMFILGLVGPLLCVLRRQPWRDAIRQPETCIAAGLAAVYGLGVIVLVPDFATRVLPLVTRIYLPARVPIVELLTYPSVLLWAGLTVAFWRLRRSLGEDIIGSVLIWASVGFEAVFFLQGKGFTYHAYPAIALALLACGSTLSIAWEAPARPLRRHRLELALVVLLAAAGLAVFAERYDIDATAPGLTGAVAAVSPHPRILAVTGDMTLGRALARDLGGQWAGSAPIPWVTLYAAAIVAKPEQDPRFADAIRAEQERYAADIDRQHPDVILVDSPWWMRWIAANPVLAQAFSAYQRSGKFGDVALWTRKAPWDASAAGAVAP